MSSKDKEDAGGSWRPIVKTAEKMAYEMKISKACSEYHQALADRQREAHKELAALPEGEDSKSQRDYAELLLKLQSDLKQFEVWYSLSSYESRLLTCSSERTQE